MKLFRHIIAMVCIAAASIAHAGAQPFASAKGAANQPNAVELQRLQGTWEGFMVGHESAIITITIATNSLHFHRDANFWFKTTFTQSAGTDPKQLHATIKECASGHEDSVGKVVVALYKIEDGTLTLVALGDDGEESRKALKLLKIQSCLATNSGRFSLKRKIPNHSKPNEPKA